MNKKSWKIIIVLLVITFVIFLFRLILDMNTVYIGNNTKLYVFGSKIFKTNDNSKIILKKVNTYNNKSIVKGYLKTNKADVESNRYLVSTNNRNINFDTLIASGSMRKLDIVPKSNEEDTINNVILNRLNELLDTKLLIDDILEYKSIKYDIDNDSSDEEVVYLSSYVDEVETERIFVIDDNYFEIINYEFDYRNIQTEVQKSFSLVGLIDFNNDKKYEIVLSKIEGSNQPTRYDIYSYDNGSIKEIK